MVSDAADYKIEMYKSVGFWYMSSSQLEKNWQNLVFRIVSKKLKIKNKFGNTYSLLENGSLY